MSTPTNARQRKAQREVERKRQQQILILVGIVIATVVVLIAVVLLSQSPTVASPTVSVSGESAYTALTLGVSPENMPQLGSADAPLTIYEYGSFGCSHCMDFHNDQFQQLKLNIASGQIRFVFVPVSNQVSLAASQAAFCADDQGRFWEMGDVLFNYLAQYGSAAFPEARLVEAARNLGLNENDFRACLTSSRIQARADAANQLFYNLADQYTDITGTPTFTFNGVPEYGAGNLPMSYFQDQLQQVTGG
jgi:protein-disulfide isomerase